MKVFLIVLLLSLLSSGGLGRVCPQYKIVKFIATSSNSAGLAGIVTKYQQALGGADNMNAPGPLFNGFRQINWDAPGNVLPFNMPGDFFNTVVTRGAVFKAKGGSFAVSNDGNGDDRFNTIIAASQSARFVRFSEPRLFTPRKKNRVTALFEIPAQRGKRATTIGFAAIFTDVVRKKKTKLVYKAANGCKIATVIVPPQPKGLSFAGIIVYKPGTNSPARIISKVTMTLGTIAVDDFAKRYRPGYGSKSDDVVVQDDFIYGEPY